MEIGGELKLLTENEFEKHKIDTRFQELKRIQKVKEYKRGWIFHKMKDEFGEAVAIKYMPRQIIPEWVEREKAQALFLEMETPENDPC